MTLFKMGFKILRAFDENILKARTPGSLRALRIENRGEGKKFQWRERRKEGGGGGR